MMIKRQCMAVICLLALLFGLSACSEDHLQEDEIDTDFEQDYAQIDDITKYLLSLEETDVNIDFEHNKMTVGLGKPMEFQSSEIKKIVGELEKKGYHQITKKDNVVIFDVWRKPFSAEYESGFVYSVDGTGDLSAIQFLIYQRALSKENWYYYESNYNEWRVNQ